MATSSFRSKQTLYHALGGEEPGDFYAEDRQGLSLWHTVHDDRESATDVRDEGVSTAEGAAQAFCPRD